MDGSASRGWDIGLGLAAAISAVALAVTLGGAAANLGLRPLDGVEGELLFEASRVREGLRLYVDPLVGAHDYGPVPARYVVLYPPLWSTFLAFWPASWAPRVARVLSSVAFWGTLLGLARTALPACRRVAFVAAAFVGGVYALAEHAGSARPDAVALALAAWALARSVRRGEVDAVSGGLFALAAWTKPNVLGMGAGAIVATALLAPRRAARGAGGVLLVSAVTLGVLERVSGGAFLAHLSAATGQPLVLHLLLHHLAARAQFFAVLILGAILWAWRGRRDLPPAERGGASVALGALVASLAWALFTFAKIGSAANYWLEPCVAAVVALSRVPPPALSSPAVWCAGILVPLQALWTGVGSVRATWEWTETNRARSALVARARILCGEPGRVSPLAVSDEPGLEVTLNGRLVSHPFVLTHLARAGRFPARPWLEDLLAEEVACVVTAHDRIERPRGEVDVDYDDFPPEVRAALAARFRPAEESGGFEVYVRRSGFERR